MPDKLPIPRLRRERQESGGRRISRACDACRQRKIKCDGDRPTCSLCHAQGLNNCSYSDGKAVRQQKDLDLMKRKIETYEELLRDISGELEGPSADQVAKVLKVYFSPSTRQRGTPRKLTCAYTAPTSCKL